MSVPPTASPIKCLLYLKIFASLTGKKWCIRVVFIGVSLIMSDEKHLFIC